ncbi:uncharacterized protein L203_104091 [Cryptococcus depauperatus CBS 7841]|uniref:Transcription factor domain-containing protein n=1 Tax=Cryptococcus depauperatus CBS 7841 TaxID=1295531 RepID=A0AAJ8M2R4_9TREE
MLVKPVQGMVCGEFPSFSIPARNKTAARPFLFCAYHHALDAEANQPIELQHESRKKRRREMDSIHLRRPNAKKLLLAIPAPSPARSKPSGGHRRPSLLSLITLPPSAADRTPTTAHPSAESFNTSYSSASTTPSTATTFPIAKTLAVRTETPYEDGPVEVLPGVWLGAEESLWQWDVWARDKSRVRIVNVAQEVDDPFERTSEFWSRTESVKLRTYPSSEARPEVEYCHVRWSHGELGLAELPRDATLRLGKGRPGEKVWRFWDAIVWMEQGRERQEPVLIQSATLAIAYTMALAAAGRLPRLLGHIKTMQDAYDFVKEKSGWIGPNHSLVFQLVDFARNLTLLLSAHYLDSPGCVVDTSFPTVAQVEISDTEWARRRHEFDVETESALLSNALSLSEGEMSEGGESGSEGCMSPEEAGIEARRLDEAMFARRALREVV